MKKKLMILFVVCVIVSISFFIFWLIFIGLQKEKVLKQQVNGYIAETIEGKSEEEERSIEDDLKYHFSNEELESLLEEYSPLVLQSTISALKNLSDFTQYIDSWESSMSSKCLIKMESLYKETVKNMQEVTDGEEEIGSDETYPIYDENLNIIGTGSKEASDESYNASMKNYEKSSVVRSYSDGNKLYYRVKINRVNEVLVELNINVNGIITELNQRVIDKN